ncbi:MAG TPA: hypothetical protein VK816_10460 [Jatrophihabitantaceae bacterium]|jgi:hypothetical protein|nr:hypothetical protein [Jatrophihabitantaceae bacterium]
MAFFHWGHSGAHVASRRGRSNRVANSVDADLDAQDSLGMPAPGHLIDADDAYAPFAGNVPLNETEPD